MQLRTSPNPAPSWLMANVHRYHCSWRSWPARYRNCIRVRCLMPSSRPGFGGMCGVVNPNLERASSAPSLSPPSHLQFHSSSFSPSYQHASGHHYGHVCRNSFRVDESIHHLILFGILFTSQPRTIPANTSRQSPCCYCLARHCLHHPQEDSSSTPPRVSRSFINTERLV